MCDGLLTPHLGRLIKRFRVPAVCGKVFYSCVGSIRDAEGGVKGEANHTLLDSVPLQQGLRRFALTLGND